MQFKLLFYFCFFSQLYVWGFFVLFVHQLSSTASLLLSKLSSAAKFYFDCGIPNALLYLACFVCYFYSGDHVNCVVTVLPAKTAHSSTKNNLYNNKKTIHTESVTSGQGWWRGYLVQDGG